MATYAIGDVQGCYDELRTLLAEVHFAEADRLWFVGDLVNRGPKSLEVLRFVRGLGDRALTVLGNHDLHLVAVHEGLQRVRNEDTLGEVLAATDRSELVDWLRRCPLMHVEGDYAMVHAGLLPAWSVKEALALSEEVQRALQAPSYREFLKNMYGSKPSRWSGTLAGWDRLRVIVNAMTRMRFCTSEGEMDFHAKGTKAPVGYQPWYETRRGDRHFLLCGHWSALGLTLQPGVALLDSGCVWGASLSALRLDDRRVFQVKCAGYQAVEE